MKLYRDGIEIYDLIIDKSSKINNRLMTQNTLDLRCDVAEPLDIRIRDYVMVGDEKYEVDQTPEITIMGGVYSYSTVLIGNLHRLDKWLLDQSGNEELYYFGNIADHLDFIIKAINFKENGWSIEAPNIEAVPRNINYASMSCLSALNLMANEFELEFDVIGKTINVGRKIERATNFAFSQGKGKGLYKITRGNISNVKITTRLYGLGGKTNMPNEKRLQFEPNGYLENNVDKYGLREGKVSFDHIFPRRNSTITSDAVRMSADSAIWSVVDSTMDFDLEQQRVEGAKIVFNTGDCSGLEFEITSYDDATKTIFFKEIADGEKFLPSELRYPRSGNAYIYTGIIMPGNYTANAQKELKEATQAEILKLSQPQCPFNVDIDPRYIKRLGTIPTNGDLVRLVDSTAGVDDYIRVIGVSYPVLDPNEVAITICDKILIPSSESLIKDINKQIAEGIAGAQYHPLGGKPGLDIRALEVVAKNAKISDTTSTKSLEAQKATIKDLVAQSGVIDQITTGGITTPSFMDDLLLGYGAAMMEVKDSDGKGTGKWQLWADRGFFREGIETLKLVFNQIDIVGGELWVTDGGVMEDVQFDYVRLLSTEGGVGQGATLSELICSTDDEIMEVGNAGQFPIPLATFRIKNEGDPNAVFTGPFQVGDVVMGVVDFRENEQSGVISVGKRCYMLITEDDGTGCYQALPLSSTSGTEPEVTLPFEGMTLARWGNVAADSGRQGSVLISGRDNRITITDGVNSPVIGESNIKGVFGRLDGIVHKVFGALKGYGIMVMNGYFHGTFKLTRRNDDGSSTIVDIGETIDLQAKEIKLHGDEIEMQGEDIKLQGDKISLKVGNDELKKIGIDIQGDTIDLRADRTHFKTADGRDIAVFNSDGLIVGGTIDASTINASKINVEKLDASKIKAGQVDTRHKWTGEGVVMMRDVSNVLTVYNANNQECAAIRRTGGAAFIVKGINSGDGSAVMTNQGLYFPSNIYGSENRYIDLQFSRTGITLPRDAKMNMPGVLSAGRVNYEGAIEGKWGAVDCYAEQYYEGSVRKNGYFKITHLLGHSDYFVQITGAQLWGVNNEPIIMGTVITKNDNEVIVAISGSNSKTFVDAAFEYCIIGKNRA